MMGKGAALLAAISASVFTPAFAGAADFILVNGTRHAMESVAIRRFQHGEWRPLSGSAGVGARLAIPFKDEDCAFDIRAKLAGKADVIWSGVNLCNARAVILHREESGQTWADYDGDFFPERSHASK